MHFVDRESFKEAPIEFLDQLNSTHKADWAIYNQARINGAKPLPKRPESSWNHDKIRIPLGKLFLKS